MTSFQKISVQQMTEEKILVDFFTPVSINIWIKAKRFLQSLAVPIFLYMYFQWKIFIGVAK